MLGLSVNEEYSILQECFPYLATRLFTDNSPRAKAALRTMLVGNGHDGKALPAKKLFEMSNGFTSYASSTIDADNSRGTEVCLCLFNSFCD